jgi:hypothetical protein
MSRSPSLSATRPSTSARRQPDGLNTASHVGCRDAQQKVAGDQALLNGLTDQREVVISGEALDADAVRLAVVASVRHQDTGYDQLLMSGVARADAREQVRPDVDRVLGTWRRSR